jgi:hypothetical protein
MQRQQWRRPSGRRHWPLAGAAQLAAGIGLAAGGREGGSTDIALPGQTSGSPHRAEEFTDLKLEAIAVI